MHSCSELVNGEEFYKEFISPDTGSVSLTQLCKINIQYLDPCPSKTRSHFTVQDISFLTHTRLALLFMAVRQKVSENIADQGEIACFLSLHRQILLSGYVPSCLQTGSDWTQANFFLSGEHLTFILLNN